MSEYQHYYTGYAKRYGWASQDADRCGCNGNGWWLSQVDTWHQCPFHGKDVPHPDSDL